MKTKAKLTKIPASKAGLRRLIEDKKATISDRDLFLSAAYRDFLSNLANASAKRYSRPVRVQTIWDERDGAHIAYTDNMRIVINCGNRVARTIKNRELRHSHYVGLIAHETGHVIYTDFMIQKRCYEAMDKGRLAHEPVAKSAAEKKQCEEIHESLSKFYTREVIKEIYHGFVNIMEDIYIEYRMNDAFPGTYKTGILLNNELLSKGIPKISKQLEKGLPAPAILQNMCLYYARKRRIPDARTKDPECLRYVTALRKAAKVMDGAFYDLTPATRYRAASQLLLIFWDILKEFLDVLEKHAETGAGAGAGAPDTGSDSVSPSAAEPTGFTRPGGEAPKEEKPSEEDKEISRKIRRKLKREKDKEEKAEAEAEAKAKEKASRKKSKSSSKEDEEDKESGKSDSEAEAGTSPSETESEESSAPSEADESDKEAEKKEDGETPEKEKSPRSAHKADVDDSEADEGKEEAEEEAADAGESERTSGTVDSERSEEAEEEGFDGDACEEADDDGLTEYDEGEESEEDALFNSEDLRKALEETSEESVYEECESLLSKELQKEIEGIDFGDCHKGLHVKVTRVEPTDYDVSEYQRISAPLLQLSKRLQQQIKDLLTEKEYTGKQTGLYMGKRLQIRDTIRNDGRIFYKNRLPEDTLNLAVGLLVDESGSMCSCSRIVHAQAAAIAVYDFCEQLGIPVMVYGHSTHEHARKQGLTMYAYAEFDSVDGKDRYRMMQMDARDDNRDGAALRFCAERLLHREEQTKLLIVLSDGQPCADNYYGGSAEADMKQIKKEYTRKGITMFAAAIGADKPNIQRIYGDGFLDISDLKKLPLNLMKLIQQYVEI